MYSCIVSREQILTRGKTVHISPLTSPPKKQKAKKHTQKTGGVGTEREQ